MTISAQSIIRRCVETLQDTTSVRWPISELIRYLNDGQREVVLHRPDAMARRATLPCVAGALQALPAGGAKLLNVERNTSGTKAAVRQVNKEILDAQLPGWQGMTASANVLHFTYDPREPRSFHVYPPAAPGASLEIVYAAYPTDVGEPADGATWSAVAGDVDLPDVLANALQDYILYRAYSKDAEYAVNMQRMQAHYSVFAGVLGIEAQATMAVAPATGRNLSA